MRTEQLIAELTTNLAPVQRVGRPWRLALVWGVVAAVYISMLVLVLSLRADLVFRMREPRFVLEQLAVLLTGLTAAGAAFATTIPGYRREVVLVPFICAAVWIAAVAAGLAEGSPAASLAFRNDWHCVASITAGAALPALIMAVMIRRGAPLTPRLTATLSVLAAAGIGNLVGCLFHPDPSNWVVLVWHCGTVVALALIAGLGGRYLLPWPRWESLHAARPYSPRT